MSTSLPEGIYPGCTAISGIAQPGAGMWINIPGRGSSVRAIASNRIDSLTNLTVTVDRAGNVRVFGVGDRPPTLERTTDFARVQIRQPAPDFRGGVAFLLRWSKFVRLHYFYNSTGTIVRVDFIRKQEYWLVQPNVEPIKLFEEEGVPYGDSTVDPVFGIFEQVREFYVSINSSDRQLIHVDLRYRESYLPDDDPTPYSLRHWQVRGSDVQEVAESEAWRRDYTNTGAINPGTLTDNACINAYARDLQSGGYGSSATIDSRYRYQAFYEAIADLTNGTYDPGDYGFVNFINAANTINIVSYLLQPIGDACISSSVDADRKAFLRLDRVNWTLTGGDYPDFILLFASAGIVVDG